METLNTAFESFAAPETYHRVDGTHPLDLYIGVDEHLRWSLMLITDSEPPAVTPSRMISSQKRQRTDGRWTLTLSLTDNAYKDIFLLFCGDIIDSSRPIASKSKAVKFIIRRYKEWKEMLADSRKDVLSESQIKGLLGEMYYLQAYLAPQYGIDYAATSWTGPDKLHQDFIFGDTWVEVKTISSSKSEVNISSVEQLDCSDPGELVVVCADRTSTTNDKALNLNMLYKHILVRITDDSIKTDFSMMLLRFGYFPRSEYEAAEHTYEIKQVYRYSVTPSFPCLRRCDLPSSIVEANYTISLPSIQAFRKE